MINALMNMKGTLARVFVAYPMAVPAVLIGLSYFFPEYLSYDQETRRVTFTATLEQLGEAAVMSYLLIGGVFAKWGIKK